MPSLINWCIGLSLLTIKRIGSQHPNTGLYTMAAGFSLVADLCKGPETNSSLLQAKLRTYRNEDI